MRYQEINIVGEEYADDNRHWSAQHCVNYLPVPAERGGSLTQWQLRQAPGLKPLVRIIQQHASESLPEIEAGPIRGMREVEGKLFVVAGTTLYQITNSLVAIPYGTVPGVSRVSMTHNQRGLGNELLIVNGSAGYVFNTSTLVFQRITDEGYPGAFIADYIDSYLAQVEPQGRFWFHSDLADALNYNTLDRYEAEGQPDRIVSLKVSHREALLFGQKTIEPYVNDPSGDGTAPFQRASNTVIECGCSAKFSVVALDNSVFFLDDKRIVRRLDNYTPVRLSTQPIEQALAACTADQIAAAYAFVWEDRGHKVYYLTVPGQFTIGYDVLSRRWHRRLTKGMDRWRLSDLVFWNGKWVGGDYQSGRLYELDWAYALDGQDSEAEPLELVRRTASGYLSSNQNRIRVHAFELRCRVGGPETVPADFPEQPEGPSISGDAPDGTLLEMWGPYAYSATGGTPPYKFSLRAGTLPAGLGPLSQAGIIAAGTPSAVGASSFVVRVTDANGLFDDLTDTIQIGAAFLALPSETVPFERNRHCVRRGGAAGTDWSPASIPTGASENFTRIATSGEEILLTSGSLNYALSTNRGQTFTLGSRSGVISHSDSGRSLKAGGYWFTSNGGGSDPISRYDGSSFTQPFTGVEARIVDLTEIDGRLIGAGIIGNPNQVSLSDDFGETWTHVDSTPGSAANPRIYSANNLAVITYHAANQVLIKYSEDQGATWTQATSPFPVLVGDAGSCIHFAQSIGEDGIWVSADGKGNVAHSQDGKTGWTLATTPLSGGVFVTGVASTGGIIECSCSDGSFIRSTDGLTYSAVTPVGQPAVMHDIAVLS